MITSPQNSRKLEARGLSKAFGGRRVLEDVSLYVDAGEFVSIIGVSGSGKTTIFNIISGILAPDAGGVLIDGEDYTGRSGRVGYMHQKDLLLPWKTVRGNCVLPLTLKGVGRREAAGIADEGLDAFGLSAYADAYPPELSGGMAKRVALLRAYLFSRDILLLDEPFSSLDPITRESMHVWLLDVARRFNISVVFITHDIDEALYLSDRVYVITGVPARVTVEKSVALPRERSWETMDDPLFLEARHALRDALRSRDDEGCCL